MAETVGATGGEEPRSPLTLEELLDLLTRAELVSREKAKEIAARSVTLRSQVLKERVGSVRSQAAARYEVSPPEIVAITELPNPSKGGRKLDEDAIAECIAAEASLPYLKIDPLRIDNELVTKTLSRPFARRHAVIPVGRENGGLRLAITDPFDSSLRDSLENLIELPLEYVVSSKRDILALIDRVYGFRSQVSQANEQLGGTGPGGALFELVELRSNDELATSNDEHVIAAGSTESSTTSRGFRSPCTAPSPPASRSWLAWTSPNAGVPRMAASRPPGRTGRWSCESRV